MADEGDKDKTPSAGGDDAQPRAEPPVGQSHPAAADEGAARLLLTELRAGAVIDEKYRIDAIIGRGAMGLVAAATHLHLHERVALKFLLIRGDPEADDFRGRFRREAQVSATLRNEHITRVIDVGVWREHVPFMVMEHLAGVDLREVLRDSGPMPIPLAIDYIVQLCEGMAEAHARGVVHRDLKPSNLFLTKRADGSDLVKILDFGISKWSQCEGDELDELTQTGVVLGSPKYMAPEQLFGADSVDARADVWSIGAIFYQMLTGRPPFDQPTLARICAELAGERPPPAVRDAREDVPEALEAVVLACFIRDREHRVQSVAELAFAILDSVGAPFADAVRAKISSTLDASKARDGLSTTSGSSYKRPSGAYPPVAVPLSMAPGRAAPTPMAAAMPAPEATRAKSSRRAPWLIAALLLLALFTMVALRFIHAAPEPTAAGAVPSGAPSSFVAPPPLIAEPTAPTPTQATEVTTPPASASAPAPPLPRWPTRQGGGPAKPTSTNPEPAATTATATPAPTVTVPPVATKKPNPLGDRQ